MFKLKNDVLGIDIGSGLIKMAQVAQGEKTQIIKLGCIENPVSGASVEELNEADADLAEALRNCYKNNGFSAKKVSLCLSEPSVIFRDIKLPGMNNEEILGNVRYEMADYFSIDIDKYAVTYRILEKEETYDRTVLMVLGAAVPSDLVAKYIRIIKKAGLRPAYIDVGINACYKMIKHLKNNISFSRTVCILDYGHRTLTISLFDDGAPFIARTVERNWEVQSVDAVTAVLNQMLDYYYSRNHTSFVDKVWVAGGNGYTNGFCRSLSMQTGVAAHILQPDMFSLEYGSNRDAPMGVYLKSIGTAIRED